MHNNRWAKIIHHGLPSLVFYSILLPILGSVISLTLLKTWRYEHMLYHGALELLGSIISIAIIYLILVKKTALSQNKSEVTWTISALIMMGFYDLVHAVMPLGQHFVLFHSLATFFGGVLFACIWIQLNQKRQLFTVPFYTFMFALLSSSLFILNDISVPTMVESNNFTFTARILNIVGGIGYIFAFVYLYKRFLSTSQKDYYLLSAHCLLFGMAGILFEISAIWDAAWWWWHILRFVAYAVLVLFFFRETKETFIPIQVKLTTTVLFFTFGILFSIGSIVYFMAHDHIPDAQALLSSFAFELIGYSLLLTLGIMLLGAFLSNAITKNLKTLASMVQEIQQGDIQLRSKINTKDEVELLARSINKMLDKMEQQRKELVASESKSKTILETVSDGIITIDDKGIIQLANPACSNIFGYSVKELIGQNIKILMPEPYQGEHDEYIDKYNKTGKRNVIGAHREVTGLRKNGTTFPLDLSVSEIKLDNKKLYTGILRDITEQKKSQQALKKTLDQLQISNQELEKFAYIASHDLKSPLRAIDNLASFLKEDLDGKIDEKSQTHLNLIQSRITRMNILLNDILEYSCIGKKQHESKPMRGSDILQETTELLNIPEGFKVDWDDALDKIHINRMPFKQVIDNLVGNAVKHHDKASGNIYIHANELDNHIQIIVQDDGPGIDNAYHEQIFDMFQKLKSRDEVEGSGMGLALVKKIMDSIGGKIQVESALGKGSKFTIYWPSDSQLM